MLRAILITVLVVSTGAQLIQRQKLRFKLSGRGLPDKDNIGTTDPYVEIYYTENGSDKENQVGRTSTLSDTENPNWGDVFEFDFDRSKGQRWYFKVKDHDNAREDDTVGKAWVIVDDYVDKGQSYTVNLSKKGTLTVSNADQTAQVPQVQPVPQVLQVQPVPQYVPQVQPVPQVVQVQQPQQVIQPAVIPVQARKLRFQLSARGLPDTDLLGTTDPYVKMFFTDRTRTSETLFGRTAPINDDENPNFKEVLEFDYVPGTNQKWRFIVLDDDENRRDDEVGTVLISVDDYVNGGENSVLNLSKGQLIIKRA